MDRLQELRCWDAVQQQDDTKQFERLYHRHWARLYAIAWNRTLDEDVAKDVVQEVFVSLWERRKSITIQQGLSQFLTGILKHRLIDYFQSEQAKDRVLSYVTQQMDVVVRDRGGLSHQQVEDLLEEELSLMPENMRKTFRLRLDNVNTPTIARQLNLAEQTVSNLITEASKRLRKSLPQRFNEHTPIMLALFLCAVYDYLINR